MRKEVTYKGEIILKVVTENGEKKPSIRINFDEMGDGEDSYQLIPALYDLLKEVHNRYSLINSFRGK